jgi:hypothetical protein
MGEQSLAAFKAFERMPLQVLDLNPIDLGFSASYPYLQITATSRFLWLYDYWTGHGAMLDPRDLSIMGANTFANPQNLVACQDDVYFALSTSQSKMFMTPCGDAPSRTIWGSVRARPAHFNMWAISLNSYGGFTAQETFANLSLPSITGTPWLWGAEDRRYRISPRTANDTYPNITDPVGAPSLALSVGTGHMPAATTVYVKLAWMTHTNTRRTNYGATVPSPAASQAVGANDAITVTIPTFPAGAIGCMIFAGTDENNLALSGVARAAGAHSLKAYYDQLNMGKMLFLRNGSYPGLIRADITNLATSFAFTAASNPNPSGVYGQLFSPFFPDFWNLYYPKITFTNFRHFEKINLLTWSTTAEAEMGLASGGPLIVRQEYGPSSSYNLYELPEMGATVVTDFSNSESLGNYYVVSNVTGGRLFGGSFPGAVAPAQQYDRGVIGTSFIDGIGFVLYANSKRKQLYRQPLRVNP